MTTPYGSHADGPGRSPDGIEQAVASLATSAPASLLPDTLIACGLADGYAEIAAPIGPIFVAFSDRGVSALSLANDRAGFEAWFDRSVGRRLIAVDALPPAIGSAVRRRLDGDRAARIPFDLRGRSDFERAVLEKALEIPRGEVRPYGWIACEIGRPKAVRAVGTALGHNPIPLLIPCHRVVRSDGLIGNYSLGGPAVKRTVLAAEGLDLDRLEGLAHDGVRFLGSDTTRIFCMPTCRYARRVMPSHEVRFGSMADVTRAGYRACRVCRPVAAAAA